LITHFAEFAKPPLYAFSVGERQDGVAVPKQPSKRWRVDRIDGRIAPDRLILTLQRLATTEI